MTRFLARGFIVVTAGWLSAASALAATGSPSAMEPCREPQALASVPDVGFEEVASGFTNPTHLTHAGDGSGRLFVVEQAGTIRIIHNNRMLPDLFLDIRDRVESGGEKGLLSVAFDPRFADNGRLYVDYTARVKGQLETRVSRFHAPQGNRADPKSETVLLRIAQPYNNHNGGQLAFGPDGYLYIGMGDGGAANDPHNHGQSLNSLLGKLLRVDVGRDQPPLRYAIPANNPFVNRANARGEIWAFGLRNPWRFSFDPANGRLYLADVGQNEAEEIDVIEKGANYGWRIMEGDLCTPGVNAQCDQRGLAMPIQTYRHPDGFSVTGGLVYRGHAIAGLCGAYLYADYVTRRLWGLRYDGKRVTTARELWGPDTFEKLAARLGATHKWPAISSFGEDEMREIYLADHAGGRVLRLTAMKH